MSKAITEYFDGKIDLVCLKMQLAMLPDAIKAASASVKVKQVTNVRTIADALSQSTMVKSMLNEADKLLRAYFTFPVTRTTAERSFSSLRRVKTFLRSLTTQQRLNNLFMLYICPHNIHQLARSLFCR